jgi:NAD dependent epimerase/dehydratase
VRSKRVFLTGAGGFIGSHLTEELVGQDYQVTALVHYNSLNRWGWLESLPAESLRMVEIIAGDIRDYDSVKKAMHSADAVIHLAALIGIPYSYHSPGSYVDTNVRGTLNVLQAARELGIRKIVQTSTSEVYGSAQFVPITEEHALNPQSPYAATKMAADALALSFCHSFDLPVCVVRPFNTYGPRQSCRAVIPTIITQILAGISPLRLGDLTPTRDLNYVKDTVRGFVHAMESEQSIGEVINLANNMETSIGQLAALITDIMGVECIIESENVRIRPEKSEVRRLWGSNQKAKKLMNWEPLVTLEIGLTETIEWFKSNQNHQLYNKMSYAV